MSALQSTKLNSRVKDLTGQVFGRLTVVEFVEIKNHSAYWKCQCECGDFSITRSSGLLNGHTQSCGCQNRKPANLSGKQFGRLTAIDMDHSKQRRVYWNCRCQCGVIVSVSADKLTSGETKSCGCYNRDILAINKATHGLTRVGQHHPLYTVWCQMRARCQDPDNPAYHRYGGRGITVCERWERFDLFLSDMGDKPAPGLTIDRMDNDGPYSPDNCRWATRTEQARNRRSTVLVEFDGQSLTLSEWSKQLGIDRALLHARIHQLGWPIRKALTTPTRRCRHGNNGF